MNPSSLIPYSIRNIRSDIVDFDSFSAASHKSRDRFNDNRSPRGAYRLKKEKTVSLPLPPIQEDDVKITYPKNKHNGKAMLIKQRFGSLGPPKVATTASTNRLDASPRMPTRSLDVICIMEVAMSIATVTKEDDTLKYLEDAQHDASFNVYRAKAA